MKYVLITVKVNNTCDSFGTGWNESYLVNKYFLVSSYGTKTKDRVFQHLSY